VDRDLAEFISSVERTAYGETVLHPAVVERLAGRRREGALDQLTVREREVLGLMAQGRSNRAIAGCLSVTEHRIEKHVKSILGTLRLRPSPDHHRRVLAVLTYVGVR
jgi:DNA-binding NarL/FixJ family response regulator